MGTRTYSRRGADGIRRPTALGLATGRFRNVADSDAAYARPVTKADIEPGGALHTLFRKSTSPNPTPNLAEKIFDSNGVRSANVDPIALRKMMQEVYAMQGYDGKPTVVTEDEFVNMMRTQPEAFATMNDQSFPAVGVRAVNRESNLDDLFTGEKHHVPRQPGWYGTGTYVMGAYEINGSLVSESGNTPLERLAYWMIRAMGRAAGIYSRRRGEYQRTSGQTEAEWKKDADSRKPAYMLVGIKRGARTNFDIPFVPETTQEARDTNERLFNEWTKGLIDEFYNRFGRSSTDAGLMASMLGYDAIYIPKIFNGIDNEVLVFNRSKLIVAEAHRGSFPPERWWTNFQEKVTNGNSNV